MILRALAATLACACAFPAGALLMRPDRDEAEYLELATRYTSAVRLNAPDGNGALIAPRWVLTSARMGLALKERKPAALEVGEIQAVFVHTDIALILLKQAARIEPTPIYRGRDESGKGVVIAVPPRAGINTVDRVEHRTLGLRIKPLDDASDLQAAAEARDSGAPAYLETDDGMFVAGIQLRNAEGWDTYARVSALAGWIDDTMSRAAIDEANAAPGRPGSR